VKVYGPYLDRKQNRRIVVVVKDDGTRETTAYARWLMEEHLGRQLRSDEEVDHVDDNKLNDDLSNLQVLTPAANRAKQGTMEMITFICPVCRKPATKSARVVRGNRAKGRAGPFCGKPCARRWQLGGVSQSVEDSP
jgi:hypothetical protein